MLSNVQEKVDVILFSFLFSIPHMSLLEGLFPNVGKNFFMNKYNRNFQTNITI